MLSLKNKRILIRIISFGLFCAFFALVYALIERGIMGDLKEYPSTGNPYDSKNGVLVMTLSSLILGFFFGIIEIYILEKLFLKVSFLIKLIAKSSFYVFLLSLLFYVVTILMSSLTYDLPIWNEKVLKTGTLHFGNSLYMAEMLYATSIIILLLFIFEINDYLGQEITLNYITGKYHKPREENRIFMFLDMKSSATIAEKLGHIKYFKLLKTYYADMTDSIENNSGKVYQYVGDEIVITWDLKEGIKNNNCLKCFFSLKKTFEGRTSTYENLSGRIPQFKAALHCGPITTGEIGILKKDIFFTGDTINTASRIEKLCNHYQVDCLISEQLLIQLQKTSNYTIKCIGENLLKGKDKPLKLFAISEKVVDTTDDEKFV